MGAVVGIPAWLKLVLLPQSKRLLQCFTAVPQKTTPEPPPPLPGDARGIDATKIMPVGGRLSFP